MRKIVCICVCFLFALTIVSCRSVKGSFDSIESSHDVIRIDSTSIEVNERLVEVRTEVDSATIKALLMCDEHGNVLMKVIDQECGKNLRLNLAIDSLNRLIMNMRKEPETIYVPVADTMRYHSETDSSVEIERKSEKEIVYVEKELMRWQKVLIAIGALSIALSIVYVVFRVVLYNNRK